MQKIVSAQTFTSTVFDCLVVGAGPAGLTAAIYLRRFRRSCVVVHGGQSRLSLIPTSHNYPGFPEGIHGPELLTRMNMQAARLGNAIVEAHVCSITEDNGIFVATVNSGQQIRSKTVLIATGASDVAPPFPSMENAVKKGLLRYCPVCDGYEAIGESVAILGSGAHAAKEALFLADFSDQLSLLTNASVADITKENEKLRVHNVDIVTDEIETIRESSSSRMEVVFRSGETRVFDVVYSALGIQVHAELALQLGAHCDDTGQISVNPHMQTNIAGLFASGDVTVGLNQISIATGQSAIASTAIHNFLKSSAN